MTTKYDLNIPWLDNASPETKRDVLERVKLRDIAPGESVHRQGDDAPEHQMAICGLIAGLLRMELGTDSQGGYTVGMLREGAWFGGADYVLQRSRLMSISASVPSQIAILSVPAFTQLLENHPGLWKSLALIMSRNVEAMLDRISAVTTGSKRDRLYRVLVTMSGQPFDQGPVEPAMIEVSQEEIAVATNLTSRTVRDLLRGLENDGLVETGYRSVHIL